MKLPGTRFKTDEGKYFSHTAHSEAVELVLRDAGDARGVDRSSTGHQGLLNVGLMTEPGTGSGRVLGQYCSLLACGVALWFSI